MRNIALLLCYEGTAYHGWAVARGVISGDTSGNFRPAGTATRAEVASVLMRYLRK